MNVEEGITALIDCFIDRKKEIIAGLVIWSLIFVILWLVTENDTEFLMTWKFQIPDILTTIITMFTGLFLHLDFSHVFVNTLGFIIFMPIFFIVTQRSIFKASLCFILIGLAVRIAEIILYLITVLIIEIGRYYFYIVFQHKIYIPIFSLTSAGASGALMGVIGYVYYCFRQLETRDRWILHFFGKEIPKEYYVFFFYQATIVLGTILTFFTDLNNFNAIYGEPIQYLFSQNWFWDSTLTYGNPYFSHTFGFIIGFLLSFRTRVNWDELQMKRTRNEYAR